MAPPDDYGDVTARFYDGAYRVVRDGSGDREFYLALAREAQAPVLELGCGTGRVLLPIAAAGIPCTGLDASPRMLAELRRKPFPPTLRLVCADMKSFDLGPDRFGLIYSAFRAFQHLDAVEDQLACLACVRRHLAPGGCFVFDVFAPRLDRMAVPEEPEREDVRFEQDGETVVRYASVKRDLAGQSIEVAMRYERWSGGERLAEHSVQFRMRYFFRYELEHLLRRAGFDRVEIFGAFDRRPYDYYSGEQIVVAC